MAEPGGLQNQNLCEKCNYRNDISTDVFDTGVCGLCGQIGECVDSDLIDLYRGLGFEDQFIFSKLPRLRGPRTPIVELEKTLSWFDIGEAIANTTVINIRKKREHNN